MRSGRFNCSGTSKDGRAAAVREVMDRLEGKVPQPRIDTDGGDPEPLTDLRITVLDAPMPDTDRFFTPPLPPEREANRVGSAQNGREIDRSVSSDASRSRTVAIDSFDRVWTSR
jgi:hypothetical protein